MTTNTKNLGRLEKVELRKVWENEAGNFTPWLAQEDNIALLGDTIGIDLEIEAQEKTSGHSEPIFCVRTRRPIIGF